MGKDVTYLKNIKSEYEKDAIRALKKLGHEAILDSYGKRGFTNRTRNLHDSYASAVYYKGTLVGSSVQYLGAQASNKRDKKTNKTGRQTARDYLHSHTFGATNNEIVLVVIAAMYYAGILEAGDKAPNTDKSSTGPGAKYIVISPARSYINKNMNRVMAEVNSKYGIKTMPRSRVIRGEKL